MTLNPGQGSIKVNEEGAIRYVSYDLLLLLHSNFVLKRIVFEIFTYENYRGLETRFEVNQGH